MPSTHLIVVSMITFLSTVLLPDSQFASSFTSTTTTRFFRPNIPTISNQRRKNDEHVKHSLQRQTFQKIQPFTKIRNTPTKRLVTPLQSTDNTSQQQQQQQPQPLSPTPLPPPTSRRTILHTEKFSRLPVWPAWNGVFLFILSRLFGSDVAARAEDAIGGRVCPNFFSARETSPFIMLVHHRHSFASWDALRFFQRTFFPEGFPAHPHRGFVTVTYILKGGFTHRDSIGIKQIYGAEKRHNGKHTQWLSTGAGILHEEMFDIQPDGIEDDNNIFKWFQPSSQELYQLWLNVPSQCKLQPPRVELLGGDDSTPTIVVSQQAGSSQKTTKTVVICGTHDDRRASVAPDSDVTILHVTMDRGTTWTHEFSSSKRQSTAILYVRRGTAVIEGRSISPHRTAYLSPTESHLVVATAAGDDVDFLFLAGEPLNESVAAQGSMVMNDYNEINEAYADYQGGLMGRPWSETLSDEEWRGHVREFPSRYRMVEEEV